MMAPARLELDTAAGTLLLCWPDGQRQSLDHGGLRAACRCAGCRAGAPARADADIRIVALHAMGYGVQMVFSDSHARGIYPWAYLRALGG